MITFSINIITYIIIIIIITIIIITSALVVLVKIWIFEIDNVINFFYIVVLSY